MTVLLNTEDKGQSRLISVGFLVIGLLCMVVAGYFLIEGLLQFGGGDAAKRMLIVAGILFQVTESLCFISAAGLAAHSMRWRHSMFLLGLVLFSFSIAVMTFAQKAALETGEAEASAIDEQRKQVREQLTSLDELITSYQLNAERQSKSIFADSRRLGQDSINKATELAEKRMSLTEKLYGLTESRRQTSHDFFIKLEEVTGLNALKTEFWFLFIRSFLLEICGIMLMSFGSHLLSRRKEWMDAQQISTVLAPMPKALLEKSSSKKSKPKAKELLESTWDDFSGENVALLRPQKTLRVDEDDEAEKSDFERFAERKILESYAMKLAELYQQSQLKSLNRDAVKEALDSYYDIHVDNQNAAKVATIAKEYLKLK